MEKRLERLWETKGYRKVANAWVALGPNGESQLHILFEEYKEPYILREIPKHKVDGTHLFVIGDGTVYYHPDSDGMVYYGDITFDGKYWSTRAGVVNYCFRDFGTKVVDIFTYDNKDHYYTTGAISLEFANTILTAFDLPFHYTLQTDRDDDDIVYILEQNGRNDWVGAQVQTKNYGKGTILATMWRQYGQAEVFKVETEVGVRYLMYSDLVGLYKGVTRQSVHEEVDAWFKEHDNT